MPQDGRRSVGYRPFVTCDDPKGVVECGTIRRSNKSNFQKMEPSSEIRLLRPKSSLRREELGQASFQLLEVSKGAQKLNHMIESWSKGIASEGQPKEIAKDLLKGALDLQESLMMLGKLQAASKYVARLKQKQENSECPGFQRLEVSPGDECSRKKIEELREAIKAGLAKQKQLELKKSQLMSEVPSTSSSQSPSVNHDEKIDLVTEKKTRGTNLIAKLMGLEEVSSRPAQRNWQAEKMFQQQKNPDYNVQDMPKLTKPEPGLRADKRNQKSLQEILESMECKGLLRSSSSMRKATVFNSDDAPPIVLIRPSREPCTESSESSVTVEVKAAPAAIKDIKIVKANEKFPAIRIDREEDSRLTENIHEKPQLKEAPQVASYEKRSSPLPEQENAPQQKGRNADKDSNKLRHSSPPAKERVEKEKHGTKSNEIRRVTKGSRVSPEKVNSKAKSTQRSEELVKKNAPVAVKPEDRPNRPKREVSPQRSQIKKQDQNKSESSSQDGKQNHTKKEVLSSLVQKSKKTVFNQQTRLSSQTAGDKKRTVRKKPPVEEPKERPTELPEDKLDKNDAAEKEDVMKIDIAFQSDPDNLKKSPDNVDVDNPDAYESGISVSETGVAFENSPTVLSTSTTGLGEETTCEKLDLGGSESRDHLRSLLLNSPSFLSHAEDFLGFIPDSPVLLQKPWTAFSMSPDERLLIDYANELIECRIDDRGSANSPLVIVLGSLGTYSSFDNLLEKILKGIEYLSNYNKLASESLLMDGVYSKLQRDLYLHRGGALSKLWDAGWTRGFCSDDAEHVLKEVEETVLCSIIEEILTELVL